ncbi:MAG TPA: efflux RND transporter periplasmic adaptor subunit [Opitutaceae bacterium]|nr:efflux RND transporter periplasmic adaptor subunit [Opitutaceae bacterium]
MSPAKPTLDDLRIERGPQRNAPPRLLLAVVAAVVAVVMAAVFWWEARSAAIPIHTAVAREAPRVGNMRTVLNASGYVTARREATVSSKVTGKVTEVLVEEGMHVTEGQVLARLDDTNIRASLQLAQAQAASAKAALDETRVRLREAEQELQRQTELRTGKVATQADFDHAQAAALAYQARLEQQQADVAVAERTIAVWQQQLDDTVIRAPFAGIATSKNAQPGEMISPISAGGGFTRTGICTVVDMSSLEIEIDVNESYINRVESGQPVEATLDAYPDWKIPCKVIAIIPTADRDKSTVKVRVGFDQLDPRILPEMSVKVAFREAAGAAGAAPTVLVPKAAVQQEAGRDVVMVVHEGRAERRAVTVISAGTSDAELSAGVAAGESVVVDAPKELTDGANVKEIKP